MFTAGASVQWLRDEMKMLKTVDESEYVAQEVEDTDGVYIGSCIFRTWRSLLGRLCQAGTLTGTDTAEATVPTL